MKELGRKTGVLVGMDLPLASGGTETGIPPESEEKHLRQSETADLWQPKWNENQTVLATAIQMRARTQVSWKGQWRRTGV